MLDLYIFYCIVYYNDLALTRAVDVCKLDEAERGWAKDRAALDCYEVGSVFAGSHLLSLRLDANIVLPSLASGQFLSVRQTFAHRIV